MKPTLLIAFLLISPAAAFPAEPAPEPATKTLVWPDGTRYVGGVIDGKRSGKGTIFWQDGTRFVGQFKNDMRNGPGTMILPDGTVYTGFFRDDELVDSPAEQVVAQADDSPDTGVRPPEDSDDGIESASTDQPASTAVASVTPPAPAEDAEDPSASIPGEQVTVLTDQVKNDLIETIDLWGRAWSEKNVPQYLSNYSEDFRVPGKLSRKKWEALRRSRLTRPRTIDVRIVYEKFEMVEPDVVDVYFRQTYRSNLYSDVTNKVLRMKREGHDWRIILERSR